MLSNSISFAAVLSVVTVFSCLASCSSGPAQSGPVGKPRDVDHENLGHLVGAIRRADTTSIEAHQRVPKFYSDIRDINVAEFPNNDTMARLMVLDKKAPGAARAMALRWHSKATSESEYALRREWIQLKGIEKEKKAEYFKSDYHRIRLDYYSRNWKKINDSIDRQLLAAR